MTAARAIIAACVLVCGAGCAGPLASGCVSALAEVTGRMMCSVADSFCRGDEDFDGDVDQPEESDPEASKRRLAEAPPPEWSPEPGRAACERSRTEGFVHVSCADGARAVFRDVDPTTLVVEEDTTSEDPCVGRARKQGVDADGDGALSAFELSGRVLVCESERELFSPTVIGDLAILDPDDVALVAGRRAITGGLTLSGDALVSLELPQLRSIGGTLRGLRAPALEHISIERLTHVGGDVALAALPELVDVDLPRIAHVGGAVVVTDNPKLPQRALERVVVRLSRKGFSGPVVSGGNAP